MLKITNKIESRINDTGTEEKNEEEKKEEKKLVATKQFFWNKIPLLRIDSNYMHMFEIFELFCCKLFSIEN